MDGMDTVAVAPPASPSKEDQKAVSPLTPFTDSQPEKALAWR
jgi:hypothetical protein